MKPRPKGRGFTAANLNAYLIPVVVAAVTFVVCATRIMTVTPVIVLIIIVTMT
jgi:hypothetical protein